MRPKLVLIEGLPGFGKTTTAQLVHEIITEMNINSQLFLEGDLEHPADYDGVACFEKNEFDELLRTHEQFSDLLRTYIIKEGNKYILHYRKIITGNKLIFPDELMRAIVKKDIYELPLDQNRELITKRWEKFTGSASNGTDLFIFDCCFIQNPVTIGMIKYNAAKEEVLSYVNELAAIVERLNPLLLYVDKDDLELSFRKAVKERPEEWSKGFIEYYTNQGYGKEQGYKGLEGTLQVLKARRMLEEEILNGIKITKQKVNNSPAHIDNYKQLLWGILSEYLGTTS
ncbi:hypothetical protein GCM10010912_62580 [Paenibacillus albidus]|uniref:Uncharacterized protein n=1 Tax=Paenibacillus albidus TaxID=2041023 RepID=A0A917FWU3_9BACL|nr:hypothetical protein [Paenibacillus albidus]GGG09594.1 hypothetical protein GCM10010912_62580 [Paenibacillus albidus]